MPSGTFSFMGTCASVVPAMRATARGPERLKKAEEGKLRPLSRGGAWLPG